MSDASSFTRVDVGGVELHVRRFGDPRGPTTVFLHGLVVDNLASWYFSVAGALAGIADIVLYDLRGHGKSDRPPTGYTVEDMIADLDGLLDALEIQERVELVGNSFGGLLAISYAIARPERVRGLALLDANLPDEEWSETITTGFSLRGDDRIEAIEQYIPRRWPNQSSRRREDLMETTARELVRNTTLVEDIAKARPVRDEELRSMERPALVMYGRRSAIVRHAERLVDTLPHVRVRYFPDSSHLVLWEEYAGVREVLAEWLARPDPDSTRSG